MNSKSVTIETVLDGPLSKFQALALGLCMLVGLVDGYDVLTMAYAAPVMQKSLMLSPTVLGMLFSTGIGGGIFGLLVCGTLADRLGRRPLLLAAVGIFAVFTYMTAVVGQPSLLFAVRFLAGVGLGVGTAVAFASNAEWAPPKIRVTAISGVTIGYSIGAGSGGFLAGYLIPAFGWQSIFYTGASAAAVVFVLLLVWYPESPSLLLAKGKSQEHIKKLLVRAKPRFEFEEGVHITSADYESVAPYPVKALFTEGRARTTLLIWAMFFANLIALYSIQQWLPYAMHQSGADIKLAVSAGGIFQAGGVLGALVYSRVVDKFGYPFYLLSGCFVLAAVSFLLLGSPAISADPKIVTVFCAGLFVAGTQITLNSVATTLYPTSIRATAISWAVAVGRIGGVGGPILSGYLLQHGVSADGVLSGGAVPSTVAAIAALTLALSPHSTMKWNRNLKREKSA